MTPTVPTWIGHLAVPFVAPLPVLCTPDDAACIGTRIWGRALAQSALRGAGDAALSAGVRAALTVPIATFATTRWALARPRAHLLCIAAAPLCGLVGGTGLAAMGVGCDLMYAGHMLGLAAGAWVYALGLRAADTIQETWLGAAPPADIFARDRAATARVQARLYPGAPPGYS